MLELNDDIDCSATPRAGRRCAPRMLALAVALACAASTVADAQIRTDGTLGGPAVSLTGPNFLIGEALGKLSGHNLFHSFQLFNVGTGQSATFTTTTPALANVVSRVTGGSASQINGLVRLDSANAAPNFFFINPAGVVFGKGATIDVPAGFHVSTANYIKFPDGNFYADPNVASTLSSAPPEAFGFLGTTRATIALKDGAGLQTMSTGVDQPISLVAGDLEINNAQVATAGGEIRAIAAGPGAKEVALTGPLPRATGNLGIRQGGALFSSTGGALKAGDIGVAGGNVTVDGGGNGSAFTGVASLALPPATGGAGTVTINAAGTLKVVNAAVINTDTYAAGQGGAIKVSAGDMSLDGSAIGSTARNGSHGDSGSVDVAVTRTLIISGGATIGTATESSGRAGAIKVSASDILLDGTGVDNVTGITSRGVAGTGGTGTMEVSAKGQLFLVNGGAILSDIFAAGSAGAIKVSAGELYIDRGDTTNLTGILGETNPGSTGNAASVAVNVGGTLTLLNRGVISSDTFAAGQAGTVNVAAGSLVAAGGATIGSNTSSSGNASAVKVAAGDIILDAQGSGIVTGITSRARGGSGNAGSVEVTATGEIQILHGGDILSDTSTPGNAGAIKVSAGALNIDGDGSAAPTGIFSSAQGSRSGNAGSIEVTTAGTLALVNRGRIDSSTGSPGPAGNVTVSAGVLALVNGGVMSSNTFSAGNAGTVKVSAGDVLVDGAASQSFTGISSSTQGSAGNAGRVDVTAARELVIVRGGEIVSNTFSPGNAGVVAVTAKTVTIDGADSPNPTGIFTSSFNRSSGRAGDIDVTATGTLSIVNGGSIDSGTFSPGGAGTITVSAGTLAIASGGLIDSNTLDAGNAGVIKVTAGNMSIDAESIGRFTGISSSALDGTGNAGSIDVDVRGTMALVNGGGISSSTLTSGRGGTVKVHAGSMTINARGSEASTGIASVALDGTGSAGNVDVAVDGTLAIVNGGGIITSTLTTGQAGTIKVSAGDMVIDGQASPILTGISSSANGNTGNAGTVEVAVARELALRSGGQILSDTFAAGNAGVVKVNTGSLTIDGKGRDVATGIFSAADRASTGNAGNVDVATAGALAILNGGAIDTSTASRGRAGTVNVNAAKLSITSGGSINSNTDGSGDAGTVTVTAGEVTIDRQGDELSTGIASRSGRGNGNAGSVNVNVAGQLSVVNGGVISTSTFSSGQAGTVKVTAGDIVIDGRSSVPDTGIASQANEGTGNAGSVDVTTSGTLSLLNAGGISSNTSTSGRAGSVRVNAGTLTADSGGLIGAVAERGSSGQTGTVSVQASEGITLSGGAQFSIRNDAIVANPGSVTPTSLTVTAPYITLENTGQITAASTGNVAASNIAVNFGPEMLMTSARISTSARDGNGGSIAVAGDGLLVMQNSQITTSVSGLRGNGGDISIATPILLMQTGFIQGNTAAKDASGGNVNIEVATLLPSGGTVFIGGETPYVPAPGVFGFNVIQAAAPTGVSGTIRISTPAVDIVGSLSALPVDYLDAGGLARSPCAITGGSSLSQVGRGGRTPAAGDLLWPDPVPDAPLPPSGAAQRVSRAGTAAQPMRLCSIW